MLHGVEDVVGDLISGSLEERGWLYLKNDEETVSNAQQHAHSMQARSDKSLPDSSQPFKGGDGIADVWKPFFFIWTFLVLSRVRQRPLDRKGDINAALVAAITQANRAVHYCKFFLCE